MSEAFKNPYRPGAGHMPPYLAGREIEFGEFGKLLEQEEILENLVLTGLRGVGKTVLLEKFKPLAVERNWLWVGTDLSESASVSESNLATRLLADLSVATASLTFEQTEVSSAGLQPQTNVAKVHLDFATLSAIYNAAPGLVTDKIKAVLEFAWEVMRSHGRGRTIFAYDEAQNLSDHAARNEFPLSVLLDVFQSIQRKGIPFMLVLTGLPTLFPKLVDARTYAERMFRVVMLESLNEEQRREAIKRPIQVAGCPVSFDEDSVATISEESGGYPYFIQFICREVFDVFIQQFADGTNSVVPVDGIQRKLDSDFFSGRWARTTDRQRELMWVVAHLERPGAEFAPQELVASAERLLVKPFSPSHANQMLGKLSEQGLIYKNRFGRYSFAVPLLSSFILRTFEPPPESLRSP